MNNKIVSFVFLLVIILFACTLKKEESQPQKPIDAQTKANSITQETKQVEFDDSDSDALFIDKNRYSFVENRIDSFAVPDYDLFEQYKLTSLTDTSLTKVIYESALIDWYEAKTYYFSFENRLKNLQDFTVFILNSYSYNIVYCVLNNENKLLSTLIVAYQFSEGEYSEYASGKFVNNNEYHLHILGVAEPFEDIDGMQEGSETESDKVFVIDEAGMIEEL